MKTQTDLNLTNLWTLLRLTVFNLRPAQPDRISLTADEYYGDPTEEIAGSQDDPAPATLNSPEPDPEEFERDYIWFLS
jgi:hypothetical protein